MLQSQKSTVVIKHAIKVPGMAKSRIVPKFLKNAFLGTYIALVN